MKKTISFNLTPNTPENAEKTLSGYYGEAFWVEYHDISANEKRARMGVWNGPEFNFPAIRLTEKPVLIPKLDGNGEPTENYVTGWFRVKNWREDV